MFPSAHTGKSRESEEKRINKELANIRGKFGEKKQLSGYDKKKYICKLIFTFLLGYDVEFGHMEAVNLMSAISYSEKQMVRATQGERSLGGLLGQRFPLSRTGLPLCLRHAERAPRAVPPRHPGH